jgi:hypothetical protein
MASRVPVKVMAANSDEGLCRGKLGARGPRRACYDKGLCGGKLGARGPRRAWCRVGQRL